MVSKGPMGRLASLAALSVFLLASACGRSARVAGPVSVPDAAARDAGVSAPQPGEPALESGGSVREPGRAALEPDGSFEDGQASWYGDPYDGRRAASGEVFDKNKMTAAHRTLPFDTWVRVENRTNGRTVDVRINDRGPFVEGRIIDLSEAAARELDMIRAGVVPVRISILQDRNEVQAAPAERVLYVVQVGAFRNADNARHLANDLADRYMGIYVEPPTGGGLHRVLIGRAHRSDAESLQDRLRSEDGIDSIVVQVAD